MAKYCSLGRTEENAKEEGKLSVFSTCLEAYSLSSFEAIYKVFKICILMMLSSVETHHRLLQWSYKRFYGVLGC